MSRAEAWFHHVVALLVAGTGLVYAWMRYLVQPTDEFALVNHPWEPDLQHLHLLFAPLAVFAFGLMWREHVWPRFRAGAQARRRSGLALLSIFLPMAASGYLLQVATGETWRQVWIVVHVASSSLWIVSYLAHQLVPSRRRATQTVGVRG